MEKRVLGIDFGTVRMGFAISDLLGITAQGLETVTVKSERQLHDYIRGIIEEYQVEKIVVGLPLNMNGTRGKAAEKCETFANRLRNVFGLEVDMWDERLTTAEAESQMIRMDIKRKRRRRVIDQMAAQIMLQSYMEAQKANLKNE
jgi:putative pre-16S rRNA nuclease